ncbi:MULTISPECIES: hypothetical protein [unclassified Rathayibacter]|uniref:hypothetical protein n=1 Tax=unclassified Rathayibacter TaxID=2609250 RepID=UPI000CE71DCA|nr:MULTISPECIES: hypothetical protein [unclassified Rathayibacter]PPG34154.1 hypothetical protein C5C25_03525 [Rathayibacter sp. AY2B9]PPH10300.1 hypothetical protein C5C71_10190 [Rathayibacter sp. AY1C1]PPH84283.1 hypothetical protein C5C50_03250 [Rathayibacter sp. AY1D9]
MTHGTNSLTTTVDEVRPGDLFCAVVAHETEQWRVVAVLGIRVLAERVAGGDRRSFTLRFVRHQLSPDVLIARGAAATASPDSRR